MKPIVLFVLLLTPSPECLDKATKANLTNCREEARSNYGNWYFVNGAGQLVSEKAKEQVCDLVAEKDRKPVPKQEYKISLEYPDMSDDGCNEKRLGRLEIPEEESRMHTFSGVISISSSSLFGNGIYITNSSTTTARTVGKPAKKKGAK